MFSLLIKIPWPLNVSALLDIFSLKLSRLFISSCVIFFSKGLTIIWPTDFTHTHSGQISKTHEKYIITGWVEYGY